MMTLAPAVPNFLSPTIRSRTARASAASSATNVPLPDASPSAFMTKGKPKGRLLDEVRARRRAEEHTAYRGDGILWRVHELARECLRALELRGRAGGAKIESPRRRTRPRCRDHGELGTTGRLMFAALIHGGPHYRELREFMHSARRTYKKFEEILDVDERDSKK